MSNYEYISQELCVEKDNAMSDCKGSCHLRFEIQKETESSSAQKAHFLEKVEYAPHIQPNNSIVITAPVRIICYSSLNCILFSSDKTIDTPPPELIS